MQYVKKIFKKNSSVVSVIFFYMGDFSMANFYTGYFFTNNFVLYVYFWIRALFTFHKQSCISIIVPKNFI